MPTATKIVRLDRAVLVLAVRGLLVDRSNSGSARRASSFGSDASIGCVRLMTQHTLPRHSTLIFWPGSSLLMSTSTGAPAAFARSRGLERLMNGTAAIAAPTPPTTPLAVIRNRRRLFSLEFVKASDIPMPFDIRSKMGANRAVRCCPEAGSRPLRM